MLKGVSLIPPMTSNTTPKGFVNASVYVGGYEPAYMPWRAFDRENDDTGDVWGTPQNTSTGWLSYTFTKPTIVNGYRLTGQLGYQIRSPYTWTFEGLSATGWIVLDTRVGVSGWVDYVYKEFSFKNTIPYKAYRINVFQSNTSNFLSIAELQMFGPRQKVDHKSLLTLPSVSRL